MPGSLATNKTSTTTIRAASIARAHTYLAFTAFLSALALGCLLHYEKIVKNDVARYPEEWFPSVSATIGDWYPERNLFQVLVALTAGPRFALTYLQYRLHASQSPEAYSPSFVFWVGIVRTFMCGGWVYVPSFEAHTFHDFAMIGYIVSNLPWMLGGWACSSSRRGRSLRRVVAGSFFGAIVPLVYFYIQHKVHRIPGAYTHYAFFEWSLIFLDVLYDGTTEIDFREANYQIAFGASLDRGFVQVEDSGADAIASTIEKTAVTEQLSAPIRSEEVPASSEAPSPTNGVISALLTRVFAPTERHESLSFMSDVYLSYIYWTILTSLAPAFFYYSVWQLGVAGQEVTLLTTLSPILLAIPPIHAWATGRTGKTLLWIGGLVGIASYITRYPIVRLVCVGLANGCLSMVKAIDWSEPESAVYEGTTLALGLILSSALKHANHSNNPAWPILNEKSGGYNKTALVLALAALYETHTRPIRSVAATPPSKASSQRKPTTVKVPIMAWLPASFALASVMFSLHQLFADSSTIISWTWTGYPVTGPEPNIHGSITLIAQSFGMLVMIILSRLVVAPSTSTQAKHETETGAQSSLLVLLQSPAWYAFGATSAYVLYSFPDWTGYAGGLAFGIFLMSIIPVVLQHVSKAAELRGIPMVFMTTWLVVSVLDFVSVMTVAYAFVPGAHIFRERTDLVLAAQVLLLAPAFPLSFSGTSSIRTPILSPRTVSYARTMLALTSILAVVATIYRLPTHAIRPHRPGPRIVRAGIWTVHFGIDDEGRDSQRRMRDLIKDMELDIVGLLETDLHRIPYGNRDLNRLISEDLGFYVDLGPGPNKHTWGAVLLSKYPIINSTHHLLPSPNGELAPAIEAVLDIYGTEVTVIVAHNGQEEDALDRELQSTELARIMAASYPQPVIFLGYVVTKPLAKRPAPYEIMTVDGKVHDIDQSDWDRWCEYILYRGLYRTSYARISRSTITDTELQVGQFVVPEHGKVVEDDSYEARYMRSFKEVLPEEHWFPMEYYGNADSGGVRGHFYHVFHTPLYYKWPGMPIIQEVSA